MPQYAVEIGKIMLKSDKPITQEARGRASRHVKSGTLLITEDGDEVEIVITLVR